jgi:hypothetical protein
VAVDLTGGSPGIFAAAELPNTLVVRVFEPSDLFHQPRESARKVSLGQENLAADLTVFAGRVDASDSNHLTITLIKNGKRHILDGWLENNDTVSISERDLDQARSQAQINK